MTVADTEPLAGLGDASEALRRYEQQLESIGSERARLKNIDGWFSTVRVALFFFAICAWLFAYFADVGSWVSTVAWLAIVVFVVVVVANEPVRDKLTELHRNRAVFARLIARLNRDWDKLANKKLTDQLASVSLSEHQRDVADDLDLLGKTSLFHLVSMAGTTAGVRTLGAMVGRIG